MLNPLLVDLPTIISDNDLRPPLPILELLASLVTQPNPQNPIEFIWRFCPSIVAKRGMGNPTSWRRLLRPASKCRRCKLPNRRLPIGLRSRPHPTTRVPPFRSRLQQATSSTADSVSLLASNFSLPRPSNRRKCSAKAGTTLP